MEKRKIQRNDPNGQIDSNHQKLVSFQDAWKVLFKPIY